MKRKMLLFISALSLFAILIISCGKDGEFEDSATQPESENLTQLISPVAEGTIDGDVSEMIMDECCENISVISQLAPSQVGCCAMRFTLVDPTGCATMNTVQHTFPTECITIDNNGAGGIVVTLCCEAGPGDFIRTVVTSPCEPGITSEDWTDFTECGPLGCCATLDFDAVYVPSPIPGCCSYEFTLNDPLDCGTVSTIMHDGFDECGLFIVYPDDHTAMVTVCCTPEPGAYLQAKATSECDPQIVSDPWTTFKGCSSM